MPEEIKQEWEQPDLFPETIQNKKILKDYSPEELAEIEKERTLSDAELLSTGADYEINKETGERKLIAAQEQIKKINEAVEDLLAKGIITQEALNNGDIEIHIEEPAIGYEFEMENEQRLMIEMANFQVSEWKNHIIDTYDQSGRCRIRLKNGEPRLSLKVPLFSKDVGEKIKCCIRLEFKPRTEQQAEELLKIKELISAEPETKTHEKWGTPIKLNNGDKVYINKDDEGKAWIEIDGDRDIKELLPEGITYLGHKKSKINVATNNPAESKIPSQKNPGLQEIEQQIFEAHEEKEYRPVAVAIVKDGNGRILFVQSAKNPNDWSPPQGGIDSGEDVTQGLLREMDEEVGVQPEQLEMTGYQSTVDLDAESGRQDKRGFTKGKRYFFFNLKYTGPEELKIEQSEIASYKWVNKSDVNEILATTRPEKRAMILKILNQI